MNEHHRRRIGDVLVEAGLITTDQLGSALVLQKSVNKRLGKVLIELGYVSETQIAEALSSLLCVPLVSFENLVLSKELLGLIPKEVAKKSVVIPLQLQGKKLRIAVADPLDWNTIQSISFRTGLEVSVAVADEATILKEIERHYGSEEKVWDLLKEIPSYGGSELEIETRPQENGEEADLHSLHQLSEAPPIVRLVTMVLADAVKTGASDIHIEPQDKHVQVRYRIDGELRNVLRYGRRIHSSVVSRIKIKSNLDITNRRLPQDGRGTLKFENKDIDLRVSTLPSVYGENITIRLLDRAKGLIPLGKLGIPEHIVRSLAYLSSRPQGMILVTGPTGSGKTTTLYALLQQLCTETKSIFTIEDPVEYKIEGLTQVGVNDAVGLTFAGALRSILRQDPDIIMVGEIRDLETAEIAFRSALTGHLVFSTLHTNSTVSTITRLLDLGLDPYIVNSAVTGILAQRLVRRICPACRSEINPPEFGILDQAQGLQTHYRGLGCTHCQYTGYRGQIGIFEFLRMDRTLSRLIAKRAPEEELWEAAKERGTVTLFENAWNFVKDGTTTVDEIFLKIPFEHDLGPELKNPEEKTRNATTPVIHVGETDDTPHP